MKKHPRHKHGGATGGASPLYRVWKSMRIRCLCKTEPRYPYYGGRGIKICPQWDDFAQFAADVGPNPGKGWSIDRIDVNGNYEPGNVRWATPQTQARNRRCNKLSIEIAGRIRSLYGTGEYRQIDLAEMFGCNQAAISQIIRGVTWK